jgi:hypothetical protein
MGWNGSDVDPRRWVSSFAYADRPSGLHNASPHGPMLVGWTTAGSLARAKCGSSCSAVSPIPAIMAILTWSVSLSRRHAWSHAAMQLDLFAHSRDVMLRNDVIAALRKGDRNAAQEAWAVLSAEYPRDDLLAPLQALSNILAAPWQSFSDHDGAADALRIMDTAIVPSAILVFGPKGAGDWLGPMWRSLASAAAGLSYNAERPRAHAAFMSLRGCDWAAAEARVATIPSWRRIPIPLAWMAEARLVHGGLDSAWCLLVELAWIHPSSFSALAPRLEAPVLRKLLDQFELVFEPDDESELAWFPAFVLIAEPALASAFRGAQACNDTAPERAARLIMELLTLERQGRHADIVAQRKRLRDTHSGLFARYMSTR